MALNNAPDNQWTGLFRVDAQRDDAGAIVGPGGVVVPAITTAERDALTNVPDGVIILNTTTNKLNARLNGAWEAITSA